MELYEWVRTEHPTTVEVLARTYVALKDQDEDSRKVRYANDSQN